MAIKVTLVKAILLKHLRHFNSSGGPVDETTIFETAISGNQVVGTTPRDIFKAICRHDIAGNGGTTENWPQDWVKMNCKSLAPVIAAMPEGQTQ